MDVFEQALGSIDGGRVLDVATGQGGFIGILQRLLKSFTAIVGTDCDEEMLRTAQEQLGGKAVQLIQADGERMAFADDHFDTVNISASLHHLRNPHRVLREMKRVLKPGGYFMVEELTGDGRTEAQLTTVYLHHWLAAVDATCGEAHFETLPRQKILDLVSAQELSLLHIYDHVDTDSNAMDSQLIQQFDELIDKTQQRIQTLALTPQQTQALLERGQELREQLHRVGTQREPAVIIVAQKGMV